MCFGVCWAGGMRIVADGTSRLTSKCRHTRRRKLVSGSGVRTTRLCSSFVMLDRSEVRSWSSEDCKVVSREIGQRSGRKSRASAGSLDLIILQSRMGVTLTRWGWGDMSCFFRVGQWPSRRIGNVRVHSIQGKRKTRLGRLERTVVTWKSIIVGSCERRCAKR
jgi:hypothetical protein